MAPEEQQPAGDETSDLDDEAPSALPRKINAAAVERAAQLALLLPAAATAPGGEASLNVDAEWQRAPGRWEPRDAELLAEMKKLLAEELRLSPAFPEVVGERRMLRFLRGHKHDVGKAAAMMSRMLQWRRDNGVDAIRQDILLNKLYDPRQFPYGETVMKHYAFLMASPLCTDAKGNPVSYEGYSFSPRLVQEELKDTDYFILFHIYSQEWKQILLDSVSDARERQTLAERQQRGAAAAAGSVPLPGANAVPPGATAAAAAAAAAAAGNGAAAVDGVEDAAAGAAATAPWGAVVRNTMIRDLSGFGLEHAGPVGREIIRKVMEVSQDNYPEMMEACYMVNVPWVFFALWRGMKPLMSANTVRKVHVLDYQFLTALAEAIPPDRLPGCVGGRCDPSLAAPEQIEDFLLRGIPATAATAVALAAAGSADASGAAAANGTSAAAALLHGGSGISGSGSGSEAGDASAAAASVSGVAGGERLGRFFRRRSPAGGTAEAGGASSNSPPPPHSRAANGEGRPSPAGGIVGSSRNRAAARGNVTPPLDAEVRQYETKEVTDALELIAAQRSARANSVHMHANTAAAAADDDEGSVLPGSLSGPDSVERAVSEDGSLQSEPGSTGKRNLWRRVRTMNIRQRQKPQEITKASLGKWVVDELRSACVLCDKEFSVVVRKHHCRMCGEVVCGRCSGHRARLVTSDPNEAVDGLDFSRAGTATSRSGESSTGSFGATSKAAPGGNPAGGAERSGAIPLGDRGGENRLADPAAGITPPLLPLAAAAGPEASAVVPPPAAAAAGPSPGSGLRMAGLRRKNKQPVPIREGPVRICNDCHHALSVVRVADDPAAAIAAAAAAEAAASAAAAPGTAAAAHARDGSHEVAGPWPLEGDILLWDVVQWDRVCRRAKVASSLVCACILVVLRGYWSVFKVPFGTATAATTALRRKGKGRLGSGIVATLSPMLSAAMSSPVVAVLRRGKGIVVSRVVEPIMYYAPVSLVPVAGGLLLTASNRASAQSGADAAEPVDAAIVPTE